MLERVRTSGYSRGREFIVERRALVSWWEVTDIAHQGCRNHADAPAGERLRTRERPGDAAGAVLANDTSAQILPHEGCFSVGGTTSGITPKPCRVKLLQQLLERGLFMLKRFAVLEGIGVMDFCAQIAHIAFEDLAEQEHFFCGHLNL